MNDSPDALDIVEVKNGLSGMAELAKHFHSELKEQKFTDAEALYLTGEWLKALATGKS